MKYGSCHLSIVPVRASANDKSEMITQLLFGDIFEILEEKSKWIKIKNTFDDYEGWIDRKQYLNIDFNLFKEMKSQIMNCSTDLVEYVESPKNQLIPIVLGSSITGFKKLNYKFDLSVSSGKVNRTKIVPTALLYLNAPYLWGGKSSFGIDCSGFTQMVYKICGIRLKRDAYQQAQQGENLSFIEESRPGDLAFFDNEEGDIIHVGIMMKNNYIIHAHGQVRIDRLDQTGIFNVETKSYSHQLRIIKHI